VTYVLDASAVIDLLLRTDPGEQVLARLADDDEAVLATVAHLDAEVFSALARLQRAGELGADEVSQVLESLSTMVMRRLPISVELLRAAWALRDNVAARDALYVAAAQALDADLMTTDERLARAVPDLAVQLI
jgi:predicted nucleic acid-binding protein